jgi:hypothetical protein
VSRSALLGETGRIPVSGANEPARRNPVWGNRQSRTETNAGRGQAITPSSAAVPSQGGGTRSNDKGPNVIQTVRTVRILESTTRDINGTRTLEGKRLKPERKASAIAPGSCRWCWTSRYATPQPKKSVSSVQIGHPRARAAARIGQSSGSRALRRYRASVSKSP